MSVANPPPAIEAKVLALITHAADRGERCPSNDELMGIIGAQSASVPSRLLQSLEQRGLIQVDRFAAGREVTIVASGRKTAHHGSRNPHRSAVPQVDGPLLPGCTGAAIVAALHGAAFAAGQSTCIFAAPLSKHPVQWLSQVERAARPTQATIDRVNALLGGAVVPPAPVNNFQVNPHAPSARSLIEQPTRQPVPTAPPVDREPCFYCGVRGDIGCIHKVQAA